jgi:hypothetical protein
LCNLYRSLSAFLVSGGETKQIERCVDRIKQSKRILGNVCENGIKAGSEKLRNVAEVRHLFGLKLGSEKTLFCSSSVESLPPPCRSKEFIQAALPSLVDACVTSEEAINSHA